MHYYSIFKIWIKQVVNLVATSISRLLCLHCVITTKLIKTKKNLQLMKVYCIQIIQMTNIT